MNSPLSREEMLCKLADDPVIEERLRLRSERLLKLADHLETGKLSVDKFDMRYWRTDGPDGTRGCALGECVALFPDVWVFSKFGNDIRPVTVGETSAMTAASAFFYMHRDEACALFLPSRTRIMRIDIPEDHYQDVDRTREKVAAEIRQFIELGTMARAIEAVWGKESMVLI